MGRWRDLESARLGFGNRQRRRLLVPSDDQMAALNGCSEAWREQFPELYGFTNDETKSRALAVMEPENIKFDDRGAFEFRQPSDRRRDSYDMQFECRGNIKERTVSLVRVADQQVRPSEGQVWSF
ncbi:MAG: hypothetical protein V2J51_13275 [Erythrobacter sp.]|jgi:hypothetical protein|nr:hypothetical protein [Erythrobacter sp.]